MSQPDAPSLPAETIAEVPIWFVRMTNGQPWFGDGSSAYVWSNEDAGRRALLVFGNYYPVLKGASVEKADLASLLRAASERDAAVREVERLREALLSAATICDYWADESRNDGWSTHQVEPNRRLAASLRKAALGAAP